MEINMLMSWLLSSGGSIITASWILERIPKFKEKSPDVKEYIFFGLSGVIVVLAYLVNTYVPATVITQIAPIFYLISGTFLTVIVGKMFHNVDKTSTAKIAQVEPEVKEDQKG